MKTTLTLFVLVHHRTLENRVTFLFPVVQILVKTELNVLILKTFQIIHALVKQFLMKVLGYKNGQEKIVMNLFRAVPVRVKTVELVKILSITRTTLVLAQVMKTLV